MPSMALICASMRAIALPVYIALHPSMHALHSRAVSFDQPVVVPTPHDQH